MQYLLPILGLFWLWSPVFPVGYGVDTAGAQAIVVEDFEGYPVGYLLERWKRTWGRDLRPITPDYMNEQEYFVVMEEGNRKFVRVYVEDQAHKIVLPNGEGFDWNLRTHPHLRWEWRARELPLEANERRNGTNDTGAALYVTFSFNFWGKPRSIKYTYSSTLPVGTTISYGSLKILVVASGREGFREWMSIERDVLKDYRKLFGKNPPDKPLSIMLWSDSDTTDTRAEADFDNLTLLPAER